MLGRVLGLILDREGFLRREFIPSFLMPLKHTTETFLIFLLGAVLAATGVVLSTLPKLPAGITVWVLVFVVTVVYPLALGPLFRRRRADNAFRALHWLPALATLLWLVFEVATLYIPGADTVANYYEWAWTLPAVFVGFFLLTAFVLNVIRRRVKRIALLLLAFVPFVIGGVMSSQGAHYEDELASVLWGGDWWRSETAEQIFPAKGMLARRDLAPSEDGSEEDWRERLRAIERRRQRIAARLEERDAAGESSAGTFMEKKEGAMMDSPHGIGEMHVERKSADHTVVMNKKPDSLIGSGLGAEALAVMLLAGYCSVLQRRMRKRA